MSETTRNRVEQMVEAAAAVYGVEDWRVAFTPTRRRPYTLIRFAVWRVLYSRGWTMQAIGDAFGRDHGSVHHGVNARSTDPWFNEAVAAAHAVAMNGGSEARAPQLAAPVTVARQQRADPRRRRRLRWAVPRPLEVAR